jgi:hypothetical protein
MNDLDGLLSGLPAGSGLAGLLIFGLALLLLSALIAAWIARDACGRGLAAPWAWTIAAAFQPLVVLVVYLFARETLARHAPGPARDSAATV